METKDVKTLRKILDSEGRKDLGVLLKQCLSEVDISDQYGSYAFSLLSRFLIYAPVEQYKKLKGLSKKDRELLLKRVLELYPPEPHSPEITAVEFRILKENEDEGIYEPEKPYLGRTIRIFISYSTSDKNVVGRLGRLLGVYGFEVFLAHEDIRPSEKWQSAIIQNLDSTDIFIPLISSSFKKSAWTDQESGYALAKGKKIIPLAADDSLPHGFIASIQAVKCKTKGPDSDLVMPVNKIISEIKQDSKFKTAYVDTIIRGFTNSYSFKIATKLSSELLDADSLIKEQINEIVKASLENSQIKGSFGAQGNMKKLVEGFKKHVDKKLLLRFNQEYYPKRKKEKDNSGEIPF